MIVVAQSQIRGAGAHQRCQQRVEVRVITGQALEPGEVARDEDALGRSFADLLHRPREIAIRKGTAVVVPLIGRHVRVRHEHPAGKIGAAAAYDRFCAQREYPTGQTQPGVKEPSSAQ
jgi:hypothetical protein